MAVSMSKSRAAAKIDPVSEGPAFEASAIAALSNEQLQQVLATAVKTYSERHEAGDRFPPFADGSRTVTATDVCIAGTEMLRCVDLQLFEMAMWQSSSGNY